MDLKSRVKTLEAARPTSDNELIARLMAALDRDDDALIQAIFADIPDEQLDRLILQMESGLIVSEIEV